RSGSAIVREAISMVDPTHSPKTPVTAAVATEFIANLPEDTPDVAVRRLHALAAAHIAAGQADEARTQLTRATRFATAGSWLKLGDFERARERYADAATAYRRLAESSAHAALAHYLEAHCQQK